MTASVGNGMILEKKVFELQHFTTSRGATLNSVRVGWESYGELNAEASNAVLITHFFTATSHAAGVYSPTDEVPGYWDAIIGPGSRRVRCRSGCSPAWRMPGCRSSSSRRGTFGPR